MIKRFLYIVSIYLLVCNNSYGQFGNMLLVRTIDPDAQAFLSATGITNSEIVSAINKLVIDLKANNLWSKMKAVYPFVGGTATTHKFNLKDPRDLDAAFRLTFSGTWTHSSQGVTSNGATSTFANTFFIPNTHFTSASTMHLSYYSRSNPTATNSIEMGVSQASPTRNVSLVLRFLSESNSAWSELGGQAIIRSNNQTNTQAFYIGSRVNTDIYLTRNTTTITSTAATGALNNLPIYFGARNDNGNIFYTTTRQCAFSSIGDGLNPTELTTFYNIVQAFQTALNRQI